MSVAVLYKGRGVAGFCTEFYTASTANSPPSSSFWSLMAAQGSKGDIGVTRAIGATGPQGIQGSQSVQGIQGEVGPEGPQGVAGPQGSAGVGVIQVYDGNDQYAGILLSRNTGETIEVYIPTINYIIEINLRNGKIGRTEIVKSLLHFK